MLLEGSANKAEKRPEFIRLRLASLSAAAAPGSNTRARRDTFAEHVKKDDKGFTYIAGIPMVDQGQKGYCVVATVERIGRYFGSSVDQHEMAQLAETGTAGEGTSIEGMERAFQKVTGRIHLRTIKHFGIEPRQLERDVKGYNRAAEKAGAKVLPFDSRKEVLNPVAFWQQADGKIFRDVKRDDSGFDRFEGKIKTYVDQGLPLCWSLYLGMFPEPGLPQQGGGHMRIIFGYNFDSKNPAEHKVLYTDSWGAGHERKEMRADEAFAMTTGLYSMVPTQ